MGKIILLLIVLVLLIVSIKILTFLIPYIIIGVIGFLAWTFIIKRYL